jgi:hypothetical protein
MIPFRDVSLIVQPCGVAVTVATSREIPLSGTLVPTGTWPARPIVTGWSKETRVVDVQAGWVSNASRTVTHASFIGCSLS